jgi:hypothetical protein
MFYAISKIYIFNKGGDFMDSITLRELVLMVVLKVGIPVIVNVTIDGMTYRIEIL